MSLEIQRMIRDQANETRDELSKMVSWEREIQKRDDELIALARQGKVSYVPPDTERMAKGETVSVKPKKVEIKSEKEETKEPVHKSKAPKTYEEWQQYDAKFKNVDMEEDEENPKESAESHKQRGNEYFKKKNYSLALREYSAAQKLDPSNAVYFFNRATTYYQISNFVECEKDATKAISLDPRYTKAYVKRGQAREAQGKLELALQDLETANSLENGISVVEKKLKEIRSKLGISADGRIRQMNEPKVKIVDEENVTQDQESGPKIEVIEEHSMLEEKTTMNQHKIEIVEETKEEAKPAKVEVVEERREEPTKVKIIEETKEEAKPSKVEVVEERREEHTRVKIVEETKEEAKPSNVKTVEEAREEAESAGVRVVEEGEESKKKRAKGTDSERDDTKKKGKKGKKEKPSKKSKDWGISWEDLALSQYESRLNSLKPSDINESLGTDWSGEVVIHILKTLQTSADKERAFQFIEQLGKNPQLFLNYGKSHRLLGNPFVIEIIDASKASADRKDSVRRAWKLD